VYDGDYDTVIQEPCRPRTSHGAEQQYPATESRASGETLTSRFREEGIDTDPPKSKTKGFWSNSKKAARTMLEPLRIRRSSTALSPRLSIAPFQPDMSEKDMWTNHVYSLSPSAPVTSQDPPPSRPRDAPEPSSHGRARSHMRGKDKYVDMMAPIDDVDEEAEQDVVSEDTPTDDSAEKEKERIHGEPVELSRATSAAPVEPSKAKPAAPVEPGKPLPKVPVQSPLQTLEGRCLDATEIAHIEAIKKSHEEMKKEFTEKTGCECGHNIGDSDDDNDDLVSIASSIDIEEYPTVHTAISVRRVLPGEVKLVDIPARKVH